MYNLAIEQFVSFSLVHRLSLNKGLILTSLCEVHQGAIFNRSCYVYGCVVGVLVLAQAMQSYSISKVIVYLRLFNRPLLYCGYSNCFSSA